MSEYFVYVYILTSCTVDVNVHLLGVEGHTCAHSCLPCNVFFS